MGSLISNTDVTSNNLLIDKIYHILDVFNSKYEILLNKTFILINFIISFQNTTYLIYKNLISLTDKYLN